MTRIVLVVMIFAALMTMGQQAPVNSPLLEHLAGKWVMHGTVGKQAETHDFNAEWVLQHQHLFREVSCLSRAESPLLNM